MNKLTILKEAANDVCSMARSKKKEIDGAVNWADLSCVQAEKYETDDGSIGYRVFIEEASPNAHQLRQFVLKKLKEKGFKNVEVIIEW